MERYEGSEIIAFRPPKFDEYLLPLSAPKDLNPPHMPRASPSRARSAAIPILLRRDAQALSSYATTNSSFNAYA